MPNNPVPVCPERDIECGRNPKSWCPKCPQWESHHNKQSCSVCGISGFHACPGKRQPMGDQERQRLLKVIEEFPSVPKVTEVAGIRVVEDPNLKGNEFRVAFGGPRTLTLPKHMGFPNISAGPQVNLGADAYKELNLVKEQFLADLRERNQSEAFLQIREALKGPDQDAHDLLEHIRNIVEACK